MGRRPAPVGCDRRERILEAALDVFAEHGFDGATTGEIARRADATQGLIYFYFANKEGLFAAAFEHHARQIFSQLDFTAAIGSDESPADVLRRVFTRFLDAVRAERGTCIMRVLMRALANTGPGSDSLSEARRCGVEHLRQLGVGLSSYLDAQVQRGTLRPMDTALVAQLIVGGTMTLFRALGQGPLAEQSSADLAAHITAMYLDGLAATPAAQAAG